jgi:hypothetical protein
MFRRPKDGPVEYVISWEYGTSSGDFIDKIHAEMTKAEADASPCKMIVVRFDDYFLDTLLTINEQEAIHVSNALKEVPIEKADVYLGHEFASFSEYLGLPTFDNVRRVMSTLGSLSSLTKAKMDLHAGACEYMFEMIMNNLRQINDIDFYCFDRRADGLDAQALVGGLRGHPSLQSLKLTLVQVFYPDAFSVIPTLPLLETVEFTVHYRSGTRFSAASRRVMKAIARLLRSKLPRLSVSLIDFNLPHEELFKSISAARIKGLTVNYGVLHSSARVTAALTTSRSTLTTLKLLCKMDKSTLMEALTSARKRLLSMPALECLDLDLQLESSDTFGSGSVEIVKAHMRLIQSVAICNNLKSLRVVVPIYTEEIDTALADCVRGVSRLTELEVVLDEYADSPFPFESSVLVEKIRSTFSTQRVCFDRYSSTTRSPVNINERLGLLARLNRAGRAYLEADPSDIRKGIDVLGEVSDDAEALYFHLRENPLLCQRQPCACSRSESGDHRQAMPIHPLLDARPPAD